MMHLAYVFSPGRLCAAWVGALILYRAFPTGHTASPVDLRADPRVGGGRGPGGL